MPHAIAIVWADSDDPSACLLLALFPPHQTCKHPNHETRKDPTEAATSFLRLRGLVKFSARRATAAELKAEGLPPEHAVVSETVETGPATAAAAGASASASEETMPKGVSGGASQDRGPNGAGRKDGSKNGGREKPPERPGVAAHAAKKKEGEEREEEEMIVEVQAKVCQSILSADITELQFLEACPGLSYVKEFSVWNK